MAQLPAPNKRGSRRSLHIDMTPMVDLAFLLLTFFILTTTLNKKYALEVIKPSEEEAKKPVPQVKQERVLTLLLGDADRIHYYLGYDPVRITGYDADGIPNVIDDARKKRDDLVILIKPMRTSRYKNLVDIVDEMETRKIKHYYIVKETAEDRAMIRE